MIRLERFEPADFQQLIDWINTEELLMNWSGNLFSFPLNNNSLAWYIKDTNIAGESDAFVYKAVNETGVTVGHISLGGLSWKNRSARLTRVIIGDEHRGKSYCQQMMKAILKIGFEELKLHRIALGVYNTNATAIHCYEKVGFQSEGIQRDILLKDGSWWSMMEMSILEAEWKIES